MGGLDRVRELRERYEASLDEAQHLREEYHREIVKLHRSGMTLREIADGLGVSHQRVHQIVSPTAPPADRRGRKGVAIAVVVMFALSAAAGELLISRGDDPVSAGPVATPRPTRSAALAGNPCGTFRRTSGDHGLVLTITPACQTLLEARLDLSGITVIAINHRTGGVVRMLSIPVGRSL